MKRLLKGGRVVDPANGRDGAFDILIDGERIARVGREHLAHVLDADDRHSAGDRDRNADLAGLEAL